MRIAVKLVASIAVLGAALILAPAPGAKAQTLELIKPGELSVATEGTFPPFSMQDSAGKLDGLEIRVMREVAKRLKLEYKPVLIKWDSLLVGLMADQYDISSAAMDITDERKKSVTFCDGWLESGGRLLVQKDSKIKTNADIKGKKVGVLVASTWAELATKAGAGEVKTYKAETDALQDLVNGNIDGVITDSIAGAYAIQNAKLPLRMTDGYLSEIQKGWPVKKGKPNLVKAINKALADMIADGTYAKLTTDLVGYSPAPKKPIRSEL